MVVVVVLVVVVTAKVLQPRKACAIRARKKVQRGAIATATSHHQRVEHRLHQEINLTNFGGDCHLVLISSSQQVAANSKG